jgi:hypothetical protein
MGWVTPGSSRVESRGQLCGVLRSVSQPRSRSIRRMAEVLLFSLWAGACEHPDQAPGRAPEPQPPTRPAPALPARDAGAPAANTGCSWSSSARGHSSSQRVFQGWTPCLFPIIPKAQSVGDVGGCRHTSTRPPPWKGSEPPVYLSECCRRRRKYGRKRTASIGPSAAVAARRGRVPSLAASLTRGERRPTADTRVNPGIRGAQQLVSKESVARQRAGRGNLVSRVCGQLDVVAGR